MKRHMAVIAVVALVGCAEEKPVEVAVEVDPSAKLSPGCYTVDLFDPYTIENPAPEIAQEAHKFLGVWKDGAWNGTWCHDLYVMQVATDGSVTVLDAYGPYHNAGMEATAFRRIGTLKDGVLSFHSRGGRVEYRRDGEYLVGTRKGTLGKMEITMSRQQNVAIGEPIKPKKAVKKS